MLAERCRGIGAAFAPHIINVVRLIVQMGSAVAEQAASKGVRVAGGIREGRPRCGRKKKTATVPAAIYYGAPQSSVAGAGPLEFAGAERAWVIGCFCRLRASGVARLCL